MTDTSGKQNHIFHNEGEVVKPTFPFPLYRRSWFLGMFTNLFLSLRTGLPFQSNIRLPLTSLSHCLLVIFSTKGSSPQAIGKTLQCIFNNLNFQFLQHEMFLFNPYECMYCACNVRENPGFQQLNNANSSYKIYSKTQYTRLKIP